MCRTRRGRRALLAAAVSAVLVPGLSACVTEEDHPLPTEGQIIGSWSNPGGDWITFGKDGAGHLRGGATSAE